jgi:hypothetical protein
MPVIVIQVQGGVIAEATTDLDGLDLVVIDEDEKVIHRSVPLVVSPDPREIVGEALVSGYEDLDEEVDNG